MEWNLSYLISELSDIFVWLGEFYRCSAAGQPLAVSSSSRTMHLERNEMSTEEERSPEVDRPQSPPVTDIRSRKSCSVTYSSRASQNPMSSGTNVVDAGNSVQAFSTPQSFLNEQSGRPTAAVTPICQKSLPEPTDDEQGEEMTLKLPSGDPHEEEETKLKSTYLGISSNSVNAETNVTHAGMDFINRKALILANVKCQETVAVARQEAGLKLGLDSAQVCTSSMVPKTRVKKDERCQKPEDVVGGVPDGNDASGNDEKSEPEGAVELTEGFVGSSSVDPICSHSKTFAKKQTDVGKGCNNESAFYDRSPGSTSSLKVTANHDAEKKSTCTVS